MKRAALVIFASLCFFRGYMQQSSITIGETYAIVVGISDYHYIRPLSYADKDAELFSEFLKSKAGGSIKPENLFLFRNDSANSGNFWSTLFRISNKNLKKGDRVYIYFAGHGDAIKGLNEYYLLLSDCQPANDGNNYHLSLAAIDMYHLKNRIGILTAGGVQVILVLDACRTNEMVGGYASQVFNTSIIQSKVGEIAMLATGPGQVSIEDVSFGGGHGLFTYILVDALSGRADMEELGNNDQLTSLKEIQDWVGGNVKMMSEKFRFTQNPVFCCDDNINSVIGPVDSIFFQAWNQLKLLRNTDPFIHSANKTQRNNDLVADSSLFVLYNKFNAARKQNHLWGEASANDYYDQMEANFPKEKLTEEARYVIASDFINFGQQKINLYLEGKDYFSIETMRHREDSVKEPDFLKEEYERLKKALSEKWTIAGLMLKKAGKLLSGGDSTLILQLKPKINFLLARGYLNEEIENELDFSKALQYALEAYNTDSSAAYTAELLGLLYSYRYSIDYIFRGRGYQDNFWGNGAVRPDAAFYYFRKATELAPGWVSPYRSLALKVYGNNSFDTAMLYLNKALAINPQDVGTYVLIGDFIQGRMPDSAVYYYKTAISKTTLQASADIYRKIARFFLWYYEPQKRSLMKADSVIYYARKTLAIDHGNTEANYYLGEAFNYESKTDSAIFYYRKALRLSPQYTYPYIALIRIFTANKKPDSVFHYSKLLLKSNPDNKFAMQSIGQYYESKKEVDSTIYYYTRAISSKYENDYIWERLGYILMKKNKYDTLALHYFKEPLKVWAGGWRPYYNIACYYANQGDSVKAVENLNEAFRRGMRNKALLLAEPLFTDIRGSDNFKHFIETKFPN